MSDLQYLIDLKNIYNGTFKTRYSLVFEDDNTITIEDLNNNISCTHGRKVFNGSLENAINVLRDKLFNCK